MVQHWQVSDTRVFLWQTSLGTDVRMNLIVIVNKSMNVSISVSIRASACVSVSL